MKFADGVPPVSISCSGYEYAGTSFRGDDSSCAVTHREIQSAGTAPVISQEFFALLFKDRGAFVLRSEIRLCWN